jgi:nucleoid-associated protein YgaU
MKTLVERTPAQLDALTGGGPSNSPSPLCGMGYAEQLAAVTPRDDTNVAGPNLRGLPPLLGKAQKGPAGAAPKSFGNLDPGNRLAGVHPIMADRARLVVESARKKGLDIFVTQGMRTIAEQNDLYAQGRTKPGKVVTWVRGGGSYHNYGLAVDFAFHGGAPYSEKHDWAGLVAAVKEAGLESGASYGDRPHANLQVPMSDVKAWHKKGGIRNVWDEVSQQLGGPRFPGDEAGKSDAGGDKAPKGTGGLQEDGMWVVGAGDTLTEIADKALGDPRRWHEIATLNGIRSPRELSVGRKLKMPEGPAKAPTSESEGIIDVGGEGTFKEQSYTVKAGDTLGAIALSFYGLSSAWQSIADANGLTNPGAIRPGQKLVIPSKSAAVGAPGRPRRTHVVRRGDTLSSIAERHLGAASRWREIATLNKVSNPSALRIGQSLDLP